MGDATVMPAVDSRGVLTNIVLGITGLQTAQGKDKRVVFANFNDPPAHPPPPRTPQKTAHEHL